MAYQDGDARESHAAGGVDGETESVSHTGPQGLHVQIHRRVNLLVFAIAMMVGLAFGLTVWSAVKQDDITRSENLSLAKSAVATEQSLLARINSDYSNWDEAYENISLTPDEAWWLDNVQDDLFDNFGIAIAAAYDPLGQVSMYQEFSEDTKFDPVLFKSAEIQEFLNGVRAQYGSGNGSKTTFIEIDGTIYMAAGNVVQPFEEGDKPDHDTILYEGSVLVFYRPIDQSLIDRISSNFLFPDLHLHKPGHETNSGSLMMSLRSPSGNDLIHLGWHPDWPSESILLFVVPPIILLVFGIMFLVRYATRALRRSTDEIIRSRDEAIAAERSKTTLMANVSHEFRTPLNGIIGFSELMTAGDLPNGEILQYAEIINESGNHLLTVIEDVLSMSQLEMGVLKLNEGSFDLMDCARSSIRLQSLRAKREEIGVDLSCESDSVLFRGDEAKLRQVVTNLVSNAIKFSPAGELVKIGIVKTSKAIEIHVTDQGIGIAADDIKKVLRPFGQVENTLARRYEGTGLGLPIAKSLVELHGGTLAIQSEPEAGTTVIVSLPAERLVGDDNTRREPIVGEPEITTHAEASAA